MTTSIIIIICTLLLLAYFFDISASKTKIPSVILLLMLGWGVRQAVVFFQLQVPDMVFILPILGTVGLILIVLEGSLELELKRENLPRVGVAAMVALFPMLILSFGLAWMFSYFGQTSFKMALANAIPFAIISSAIAIPSAKNLGIEKRSFVTFESSLSDIFGVILFNFVTLNDNVGTHSVGYFLLDLLIIIIISFLATMSLAFLLSKIKHHVKFIPIILMVVLIYAISKIYHLPGLIFILLFGLFLGNLDEIKGHRFIQKFHPEKLQREVHKFKELTGEIAFMMRALFFLLFGYLIERSELFNTETLFWAEGICAAIIIVRAIFLLVFKLPLIPLLFIAPRGLISILLFLSIPTGQMMPMVNKSLILQVIIISALIMMFGLLLTKSEKNKA